MTKGKLKGGFEDALRELGRRGLLLVHDRDFPSLTGLTISEPIHGSWWAHPLSNDVYMISQQLQHCGDVMMMTKLVCGKETYVHRRLWPHMVAIGIARENWQLEGLSIPALTLLTELDRCAAIRMDHFRSSRARKELSEDARALAGRLLAYADDIHTESGAHARRLETWQSWGRRHDISLDSLPAAQAAREEFERIVDHANGECAARGFLPWQRKPRALPARNRPMASGASARSHPR